MRDEFFDQFSTLREEFRLLQSGFRPKNMMTEPLNSWVTAALPNATNNGEETNPSVGSHSINYSLANTSESSNSSAESERASPEGHKSTIVWEPDDSLFPHQSLHPHTTKNSDGSLDGTPIYSRSRKGHKKSRGGCFNCKRRKIKVRTDLSSVPF
jgi:hypothetical protein